MKKHLFWALIISVVICSCSKQEKTSLESLNLKSNVKSVKTSVYKAEIKFGELKTKDLISRWRLDDHPLYDFLQYSINADNCLIKGSNPISIQQFNQIGMIESLTEYDEDYDIVSKIFYDYQNKRMISYKEYDNSGDLKRMSVFDYDEKSGNIISYIEYDDEGELIYKYIYDYDNKGNELCYKRYDKDGKETFKQTLKYDDKTNKLIEENLFFSDGEIHHIMYSIKEEDDAIYWTNYKTGGNTEKGSFRIEYQGKIMTKRINYDENGAIVDEFKCDDQGRLLLESTGYGKAYSSYTYNDMGDIISIVSKKNEFKFDYEYDKHKNWTKRVTYEGIKPLYVELRDIDYY